MKKHQVLLLLFSILNVATLKAKVEIASIFNDNMVLQQQMDVNIWGTASPNKKVTIQTYLDFYCLLYHIRQEWKVENKNFHP